MEKVWLSTTYYLDPSVAALSANAERFLLRALAFCGNAETRGVVTKKQTRLLGLPRPGTCVQELVAAGLLVPLPGGETHPDDTAGTSPAHRDDIPTTSPAHRDNTADTSAWRFRNWEKWQRTGDDLLERRAKDRERKRRQRERSRDVTPLEKRREDKKEVSHLPEAASASIARERGRETLTGPVPPDGWALVRETIGPEHPTEVRAALAVKAADLVRQNVPRADVAEALRLWLAKPHAGPGLLPSLVSEAVKGRNAPPASARASPTGPTAKSQAWLDYARHLESLPDEHLRTELEA